MRHDDAHKGRGSAFRLRSWSEGDVVCRSLLYTRNLNGSRIGRIALSDFFWQPMTEPEASIPSRLNVAKMKKKSPRSLREWLAGHAR